MVTIIYIERVLWPETGLHAYKVAFKQVDGLTGELHSDRVIDYHWMESTARQCALRWAKFYNGKIEGYYE